jgi:ParB family chromosome partitioning protein
LQAFGIFIASLCARRTHYDAGALKDLAENIKAVQVIEPIIVRPKRGGEHTETFEIVAGERRWRASREAGLDTIPAIVRALDDSQVLEIQLVENLHREGELSKKRIDIRQAATRW